MIDIIKAIAPETIHISINININVDPNNPIEETVPFL
jgi:hypothetical protein